MLGRALVVVAVLLAVGGLSLPALAVDVFVQGYTKSDGTYVAPHYRSAPDSSYNNDATAADASAVQPVSALERSAR